MIISPLRERVVLAVLVVACQVCGEFLILSGTPDSDGVARTHWICSSCGTGQILQMPVSVDARGMELGKIVGGMAFSAPDTPATDPGDDNLP